MLVIGRCCGGDEGCGVNIFIADQFVRYFDRGLSIKNLFKEKPQRSPTSSHRNNQEDKRFLCTTCNHHSTNMVNLRIYIADCMEGRDILVIHVTIKFVC